MKCPHCEKEIYDGEDFCPYCGKSVPTIKPLQEKQVSPAPYRKMSDFEKAFLRTVVPIVVLSIIGAAGMCSVPENNIVYKAFNYIGIAGVILWGLAILAAILISIDGRGDIAKGIWAGVGLGFVSLIIIWALWLGGCYSGFN